MTKTKIVRHFWIPDVGFVLQSVQRRQMHLYFLHSPRNLCGLWKNGFMVVDMKQRDAVMCRLTTGIRSKECVVRRFHGCANVTECTYTKLDSIA